jgi:hypothetical protein
MSFLQLKLFCSSFACFISFFYLTPVQIFLQGTLTNLRQCKKVFKTLLNIASSMESPVGVVNIENKFKFKIPSYIRRIELGSLIKKHS